MNEFHGPRNIYIVRHCRPQGRNGFHTCIGRKDIPLSVTGIEQANQLMNYFLNLNLNRIYSSPLKRAKETAEIIAGKKIDIVVKDNFSELDMGKWDGLSFDEIKRKYPEEYEERGKDLENYIVEGGESMAMCGKRAMAGLYEAIDRSEGNILIVTHAGVIRTIISSLLCMDMKKTFDYHIGYGNISLLTFNGKILNLNKISCN